MPEQLLDHQEIRSVFVQVRRKRVAHRVRRRAWVDARECHEEPEDLVEARVREPPAAAPDKEGSILCAQAMRRGLQLHRIGRRGGEEHRAILVPFTADNAHLPPLYVDVLQVESDDFRAPDAAAV